jgi:hypothetical protein
MSTLVGILRQLEEEGFHLPDGALEAAGQILKEKDVSVQPWYVRLFTGLSAWIAAGLFVLFLYQSNFLNGEVTTLFSGLLLVGVAAAIKILGPNNDFLTQLGLALSLTGQIRFILGSGGLFGDSILVPILVIVLEVALIAVYNDRTHRFLSTMIIIATLFYIIVDQDVPELVHVLIFALALLTVVLYQRERQFQVSRRHDLFYPVRIGTSFSLLVLLILPLIGDWDFPTWWITTVLLSAVLIYAIWEITADLQIRWDSGVLLWVLLTGLILIIPAVRMPGVVGAAILLLLAFWRNDRLLLGIAAVFLFFYVGAFYYSLAWTLLQKSLTLIATGGLLLLLRYLTQKYRAIEGS